MGDAFRYLALIGCLKKVFNLSLPHICLIAILEAKEIPKSAQTFQQSFILLDIEDHRAGGQNLEIE